MSQTVAESEILAYLETLGATGKTFSYIMQMIRKIRTVTNQPIKAYHMSETQREDRSKIFKNFWLFTPDLVIEISNVVEQDNHFDITYIYGGIDRIEFYSENYDYNESNVDSSFRIVSFINQWIVDLDSSGDNCSHLMNIYKSILLPNLEYIQEE